MSNTLGGETPAGATPVKVGLVEALAKTIADVMEGDWNGMPEGYRERMFMIARAALAFLGLPESAGEGCGKMMVEALRSYCADCMGECGSEHPGPGGHAECKVRVALRAAGAGECDHLWLNGAWGPSGEHLDQCARCRAARPAECGAGEGK